MNPQVRIAEGLYEDTEVIFFSSHRFSLPFLIRNVVLSLIESHGTRSLLPI
jgi:hypothetical protein